MILFGESFEKDKDHHNFESGTSSSTRLNMKQQNRERMKSELGFHVLRSWSHFGLLTSLQSNGDK